MKIALGQMLVIPGDIEKNVAKMIRMIKDASIAGADLISFPELSVGGYLLGDSCFLNDEYCFELMSYNDKIAATAKKYNIAVAYGNIYLEDDINKRLEGTWWGKRKGHHPNHDGRKRRYNATYLFDRNGMPANRKGYKDCLLPYGVTIKTNLPNYRFFDDERYFFSLLDHMLDFSLSKEMCYQPFILDKKNIGLVTCEDLWCEDYRMDSKAINPIKWITDCGADAVINLSASPWTYSKHGARDRRVKFVVDEIKNGFWNKNTVPLYYVNCVGVQNNGKNIITFDGGSTVYNKDGDIVATAADLYEERILLADNDNITSVTVAREAKPKIAEKYLAIKTAVQSFVKGKMVNGVSGGIDSCVTQAIYVDALGAENVIGINMPSRYNGEATKNIAKKLCNNLGTRYHIVPIEGIANVTRDALGVYLTEKAIDKNEGKCGDTRLPQIVDENLQAKTRAIQILSNIAQIEGAMYSNNGNKVEIAIGYYTLDADGRGSIAPLGDLTKEEIFEMGHYLNEVVFKREVIPSQVFDIAPSAELATGQVDPIKVGYHCRLVEKMTNYAITSASDVMQWWLDGTLHSQIDFNSFERFGLTDAKTFLDDLMFLFGRERNQTFKRVQSVPIVVTSKTAYGFDRRESILPPYKWTKKAQELSEKILLQGIYDPIN